MNTESSRRNFLAAGLALPVAGLASTTASPTPSAPAPQQAGSSAGKLSYRVLGKTGMKVTTVGYGCMITSDPTVISRGRGHGHQLLRYVPPLPKTAKTSAWWERRWARSGRTSSSRPRADGPGPGPSILDQLDTSLKELNTDHVDVWLLHGLGSGAEITDELVEAQRKAKQQGKARFIGMSTHNLPAVADRVIEAKLEIVQAQYNFTSAAEWGPAIDKLNQAGVGLVAMKVMAARGGGGRGGRGRGGAQPAAPAAPPAPPVGRMTAALKWVIKNPVIATTVPSMTDIDQLEQNFAVMGQKLHRRGSEGARRATLQGDPSVLSAACAGSAKASAPRGCRRAIWCGL